MRQTAALLAAVLVLAPAAASAATYDLDSAHTEIGFSIRHLLTKVHGRFTKYAGSFVYDPKRPKEWSAEATIDADSIDTDNSFRDKDLRSDRFFDAAKCPKIEFKSTKVVRGKDGDFKLLGELTMHCVTKPVALDVETGGVIKDPWGNEHAGFSARTVVDRKEWGLVWNKTLDNGGTFVGDKVEITLDVDGALRKPKGAK
jgi:polyisoprenoid-binding protein YceI